MNALRGAFRELVERRLWPLAVVLLAAIVAAPILLSGGGSGAEATPPPAAVAGKAAGGAAISTSGVELEQVHPADASRHRNLVGHPKNPFRPAPGASAAGKHSGSGAKSDGGSGDSGSGGSSGKQPGSGSGGGADSGATTTATTTTETTDSQSQHTATGDTTPGGDSGTVAQTEYSYYVTDVRIRRRGQKPRTVHDVARLRVLPSTSRAAVVYVGAVDHGNAAGFLVSNLAAVSGGRCELRGGRCQMLELSAGESARIALSDGKGHTQRYTLSVTKLTLMQTADVTTLRRALDRVSPAGLCLLGDSGWASVVDPSTGSLRKPPSVRCSHAAREGAELPGITAAPSAGRSATAPASGTTAASDTAAAPTSTASATSAAPSADRDSPSGP